MVGTWLLNVTDEDMTMIDPSGDATNSLTFDNPYVEPELIDPLIEYVCALQHTLLSENEIIVVVDQRESKGLGLQNESANQV